MKRPFAVRDDNALKLASRRIVILFAVLFVEAACFSALAAKTEDVRFPANVIPPLR